MNDPAAPTQGKAPMPILAALMARKLLALGIVVGAVAIGVGWTLLKPAEWRASATLLLPRDDQAASGLAASAIPGLSQDPIRTISGVLESRRALDGVMAETKQEREDLDYVVKTDPATGQIAISWIHRDKELAVKVVESLIAQLRAIEAEVGFTVADREAANLEAALRSRQDAVLGIEARLLEFAETSTTAPDSEKPLSSLAYVRQLNELQIELASLEQQLLTTSQNKARAASQGGDLPNDVSDDVAKWRRQLDDDKHALELLKISLADTAPEVQAAAKKVKATQEELDRQVAKAVRANQEGIDSEHRNLLSRKASVEAKIKELEPLVAVAPQEGVAYQRLLSEYQQAGSTLEQARQRYEAARLRSEAMRVRWTMLDEPYIEEKPTNKSLTTAGLQFGALGLVLAALAAWWTSRKP